MAKADNPHGKAKQQPVAVWGKRSALAIVALFVLGVACLPTVFQHFDTTPGLLRFFLGAWGLGIVITLVGTLIKHSAKAPRDTP